MMRDILVALAVAGAAVASQSHNEPSLLQSLDRRQGLGCPSEFESQNGMSFTTFCDHNNPGRDAMRAFITDSFEVCMERCSRYMGDGEGCFGVSWRKRDGYCWLRNSTTTIDRVVPNEALHSALLDDGVMDPFNTDCPETDGTTRTLEGLRGLEYKVHCGKTIQGNDACWSGYPGCLDAPFTGYYHATSLEECLRHCVGEHPLCKAVVFNPGLEVGFANCWPKTGFGGDSIQDPDPKYGVIHTATIEFHEVDSACPEDDRYAAGKDNEFEIDCGKTTHGANISSIHKQNLTSCMDACADSGKGCVGVVFHSLDEGYENCHLQNETAAVLNRESVTYAKIAGSSTSSSPSSSATSTNSDDSDDDSSSSSQAWIAGVVVGIVAFVAILGGAIFWWRRRKAKQSTKGRYEKDATSDGIPTGSTGVPVEKYGHSVQELQHDQRALYELHPSSVPKPEPPVVRHELPSDTKYHA